MKRRQFLGALSGALTMPFVARGAVPGDDEVRLELICGNDVSESMTNEEYHIEMQGFLQALVSDPVMSAIENSGPIDFLVFEWGDVKQQKIILPWTRLYNRASILDCVRVLSNQSRSFNTDAKYTSISQAVLYALPLYRYERGLVRRVLDISGDGDNNSSTAPDVEFNVPDSLRLRKEALLKEMRDARAAALSQDVVINGLPVITGNDQEDLKNYYEQEVIGGPGSFSLPVYGYQEYAQGIERKLALEIA